MNPSHGPLANPAPRPARRPLLRHPTHLAGLAALLGLLAAEPLQAGDGTYDPATKSFRFTVSVRFDATTQQLDQIRTYFQNASALLYDATDGQHYFGSISIADERQAGSAAEFWILPGGRSLTVGRYGVEGDHSYLSFTDLTTVTPSANGAHLIVHEFAKLAYGLGAEYAGPGGFGASCIETGNPNDQTACLMQDFWTRGSAVGGLSEFCVAQNHDPDEDTWQHALHGESCWESIVHAYPDLALPNGLPKANSTAPPALSWRVLVPDRRYFIVVDKSGSMAGERIEMAKIGASVFANLSRDGDKLGVITFDYDPYIEAPLAVLSTVTRAALRTAIGAITVNPQGRTAMGWALLRAHDLITQAGPLATDMAVLVLSDGQSNQGPDPVSFGSLYAGSGTSIHTISLGLDADVTTMQTLATKTGGRTFSTSQPFDLVPIFVNLVAEVTEGGLLGSSQGVLLPGQRRSLVVDCDGSLSTATFVAAWDGSEGTQVVELVSPSGMRYSPAFLAPGVRYDRDSHSAVYSVQGAALEFGAWTLELFNPASARGQRVSLSAIGYSQIVHLAARSDETIYTWPQPMQITATAIYEAPVEGLTMRALVRRPYGPPIPVDLRDDGTLGDVIAEDGVFSGLFDRWNGDGGYTVEVTADNDGSATRIPGPAIHPSPPSNSATTRFLRIQPFGVNLVGGPKVLHSFLSVDKASVRVTPGVPSRGSLSLQGSTDVAHDDVDLQTDDLLLRVGGLEYVVPAGQFVSSGTKPSFSYQHPEDGWSLRLDLFQKDTSRARFALKDKGVDGAQLGALDRIEVSLNWGAVDVRQVILPEVKLPDAQASFSSKKQRVEGDELLLDKVQIQDQELPGRDSISLAARIQGSVLPDQQTITLRLGPFVETLLPGEWTRKGEKFTVSATRGSARIQVAYDRLKGTFKLKASGLDLDGMRPQEAIGFSSDTAFNEFREIDFAAVAGRFRY